MRGDGSRPGAARSRGFGPGEPEGPEQGRVAPGAGSGPLAVVSADAVLAPGKTHTRSDGGTRISGCLVRRFGAVTQETPAAAAENFAAALKHQLNS